MVTTNSVAGPRLRLDWRTSLSMMSGKTTASHVVLSDAKQATTDQDQGRKTLELFGGLKTEAPGILDNYRCQAELWVSGNCRQPSGVGNAVATERNPRNRLAKTNNQNEKKTDAGPRWSTWETREGEGSPCSYGGNFRWKDEDDRIEIPDSAKQLQGGLRILPEPLKDMVWVFVQR